MKLHIWLVMAVVATLSAHTPVLAQQRNWVGGGVGFDGKSFFGEVQFVVGERQYLTPVVGIYLYNRTSLAHKDETFTATFVSFNLSIDVTEELYFSGGYGAIFWSEPTLESANDFSSISGEYSLGIGARLKTFAVRLMYNEVRGMAASILFPLR